ncbi:hypothetical protein [Psychroserpens sp. NJDZ02]|uniref:hypothetical protein n=1 Tax=Psychroserpens sp. NJDZ02 TaxID=2570561 RepID=UPI0010A8CFFF|nr:hypothetical protein [Psychroserpens sp. NJDZ02]
MYYEQTSPPNIKEYSFYYEFNMPFEILLNDVIIEKNIQLGMDGPTQLNQFILQNGEQKLKIRLTHPFAKNGGKIKPQDLTFINDRLGIYLKDQNINNGKLQLIKALEFQTITHVFLT